MTKLKTGVQNEWEIVALHQMTNFSAKSWQEQGTFWGNDDEVWFIIDQQAELDFNSAN
jgi:hypothetical protein